VVSDLDEWTIRNQRYLTDRINDIQLMLENFLHLPPRENNELSDRSKSPSKEENSKKTTDVETVISALIRNQEKKVIGIGTRPDNDGDDPSSMNIQSFLSDRTRQSSSPPAIEILSETFTLSDFERLVLLLCAGVELKSDIADICATANGQQNMCYATFELAFAILPGAHWSAITPNSPLRKFRLLSVIEHVTTPLLRCPIRIEERILHYLTGVSYLDKQLRGHFLVRTLPGKIPQLPSSHEAIVERILSYFLLGKSDDDSTANNNNNNNNNNNISSPFQTSANGFTDSHSRLNCVHLWGSDLISKKAIARSYCNRLGLDLWQVDLQSIPTKPDEVNEFAQLWTRESLLTRSGLLIIADEDALPFEEIQSGASMGNIFRLISSGALPMPLFLSTNLPSPLLDPYKTLSVGVRKPSKSEQHQVWKDCINALRDNKQLIITDIELQKIVNTFDFSTAEIVQSLDEAASSMGNVSQIPSSESGSMLSNKAGQNYEVDIMNDSFFRDPDSSSSSSSNLFFAIWSSCRKVSHPGIGNLALNVIPKATLEDLVLPSRELELIKWICFQVRNRAKVYEEWGFGQTSTRGLGIGALFEGESGTGKTMAAEAIANELGINLLRVDLSAVVSKYIGETEKNLRRIFDIAEGGGSILFFDEADALFGKRSEVRDSHDRYANIEVGYLLQRLEQYRGLAILATNMRTALDPAFTRRIRFIVKFPFPDESSRTQIWKRIFPKSVPLGDLNINRLAKLNITGGSIRNIALNAAFLAAESNAPVNMAHIAEAAKFEYEKMGKPLTFEILEETKGRGRD
jgi:ATPase family associated with various cellular activities (AAA)